MSAVELNLEAEMTKNIGLTDRVIRVLVGAVILSLVVIGPQSAWGYIGLIPFLTGLFGMCPAYSMLGINTLERT